MLSKELRELGMKQLVKRTVCDTIPATVENEKTPYRCALNKVLLKMHGCGLLHPTRKAGNSKLTAE